MRPQRDNQIEPFENNSAASVSVNVVWLPSVPVRVKLGAVFLTTASGAAGAASPFAVQRWVSEGGRAPEGECR